MNNAKEIDRQSVISRQRELSELIGCPGHEEEVSEYLRGRLEGKVNEMWVDSLGNLLAVKEGREGGRRIQLDSHMDEVGFIVSHVDDKGFLRVESLGGLDPRLVMGTTVQFRADDDSRLPGIIGSTPPHITSQAERGKVPQISDMFVDLGLSSGDEALQKGIHIGSVGTFVSDFRRIGDDILTGKAFDDRTGCNIMLQVLEALCEVEHTNTILFSFSVQEEVGLRGAGSATFAHTPDLGLALENTVASDVPGVPPEKIVTTLGGGPALTSADRSHIVPRTVFQRLTAAADQQGIGWQYKKPLFGGTDAAKISQSREGVPVGILSVPARYIHGPTAMIRVSDLMQTIQVALAFCLLD